MYTHTHTQGMIHVQVSILHVKPLVKSRLRFTVVFLRVLCGSRLHKLLQCILNYPVPFVHQITDVFLYMHTMHCTYYLPYKFFWDIIIAPLMVHPKCYNNY